MATVNFLYRSTKSNACLNIRLLFRYNNEDVVIGGKSKIEVSKVYWKNYHTLKRTKDIEIKNLQTSVNAKISKLENHILNEFNKVSYNSIDNDWLKTTIKNYHHPLAEKPSIPRDLISYIDFYLEYRKNEITEANRKKVKIAQNKMLRLEKSLGKRIGIYDINEDFKKAYVDFSLDQLYSQNTQQRELVLLKTICFHARHQGLKTHHQLDGLKLNREETHNIYLNTIEIDYIKKVKLEEEYLNNSRDWLVISCFTGQRVSDFMRFSSDMIREENGKYLLEFTQMKTKKIMTIPLTKEVREVLKKRGGEFPRAISDQRYNDYIKIVCKRAKINEEVIGKRRISIALEGSKPKRNDYRDKLDTFKKWQLVSSHIGRRSFATNYYGKVPTTYLINITGHGSEKMFLNYIKKSNKDLALEGYQYFD